MPRIKTQREARLRRHRRVRTKVSGSTDRPRLCVFRSLSHIYAQIIDDQRGHTVAAASSLDPDFRGHLEPKPKTAISQEVGTVVAQRARAAGVSKVVFDRGGYKYHGRVKAVAEGARTAGLEF